MKISAVVPAAGAGARAGFSKNKLLTFFRGEPVLYRTVSALSACESIGEIVIAAAKRDIADISAMFEKFANVRAVCGGDTRTQSVLFALRACDSPDYVLIHDGARPLVTADVIARTLESAQKFGSGVAAVALKDTVKRVDEDSVVVDTPPRDKLRAVQTPQTFEAGLIRKAHAAYALGERATDDAALAERMGIAVHLTEGDVENIKLTTPEDMLLARQVILKREGQKEEKPMMRIGHGYDVHRLVENRKLILCGVEIPYALGLLGHSDADVALHALMDALLGAAALGDIGRHFPDTDPAYKGADSGKLLDHVVALLEEKGYTVGNVDVTIICQRPKLKDYIEQMRENVARHLKVDIDCVNIKATTTEKLGFEGEGLGISSHAVACIEKA